MHLGVGHKLIESSRSRVWATCTVVMSGPMAHSSHPTVWWTVALYWRLQTLACTASAVLEKMLMTKTPMHTGAVSTLTHESGEMHMPIVHTNIIYLAVTRYQFSKNF